MPNSSYNNSNEPMLELFIFETDSLLEQLEEIMMKVEKSGLFYSDDINETFRIMHTIKGSSAMMLFEGISTLTHSAEDLFYCIRENPNIKYDCNDICELVFQVIDYVKGLMIKINDGERNFDIPSDLVSKLKNKIKNLKIEDDEKDNSISNKDNSKKHQKYYISTYSNEKSHSQNYRICIFFDEDCQMENIRAYTIIHNLKDIAKNIVCIPSDILEDDNTAEYIRENGVCIYFESGKERLELEAFFNKALFLREFTLEEIEAYDNESDEEALKDKEINYKFEENKLEVKEQDTQGKIAKQTMISVNVEKLDALMDLVGEIVISEAMVTRNPELVGMQLDSFYKAASQLRKLTDELQDIVMSIRMVPVAPVFHKMQRIVRDMSKKLEKDVDLKMIGEDTEVDKNIIENISDPLMHLIRNSMDHGIETQSERISKGKNQKGVLTLEAKNSGGDVYITVKDDGKGLNKEKIIKRAREAGLINKNENELMDKEVFNFILLPGFSTKENVTEFSGRGVGMDVVKKNIEKVGGVISIDSVENQGTSITIKIPLTLAIIDGMAIAVGESSYTVPIITIRESFRPSQKDVIIDSNGNELIMIRGDCYPVLRLHRIFNVETQILDLEKGIIVVVESEQKTICLFADELIGELQVVVKALPSYVKKIKGITGCTILGDGSISLIVDVNAIAENF